MGSEGTTGSPSAGVRSQAEVRVRIPVLHAFHRSLHTYTSKGLPSSNLHEPWTPTLPPLSHCLPSPATWILPPKTSRGCRGGWRLNRKLQSVSTHPLLFSSLAQGEIPTPTWFGELLRQRRSIHDLAEANCRGLSSGDAGPQG